MVDTKLKANEGDGYRDARRPRQDEAWRRGLCAVEAEAQARYGASGARFHELDGARQDAILTDLHEDRPRSDAWGDMSPKLFFETLLPHDIVDAYYAHRGRPSLPAAISGWRSEGFPASASTGRASYGSASARWSQPAPCRGRTP